MSPILEVEGLNKHLGAFSLEDVSFTLPEGCITGFIGTNGAGKTTTIKSILGLITKDSGRIRIFGKDMDKNEREVKNRIGIVFDEGYFYEDLTMAEMKSILAPAYSNWDNACFKKYIERFQLNLNQKISTLSKGMRLKYAIALALSHHADLLIMDEPTSGLDPLIRSEIMEILLEFMEQEGKSVFFSTHITSDLDKTADMLILINNGKIIFHEDKDRLLDTHGYVKGDIMQLNEHTRQMFLTLRETKYGFEGLTNNKPALQRRMENVIIERPTVEEIMLGYVRR